MRKNSGIDASREDSVYDMAEEELQLEHRPLVQVIRQLLVCFLVYLPHCIPVAHLEDNKVLNLCIETILESVNIFLEVLVFKE
jgi:hypothetical protein